MPRFQVGQKAEKIGQRRENRASVASARWQSTAVRVAGLYLEHVGAYGQSMVYSA